MVSVFHNILLAFDISLYVSKSLSVDVSWRLKSATFSKENFEKKIGYLLRKYTHRQIKDP